MTCVLSLTDLSLCCLLTAYISVGASSSDSDPKCNTNCEEFLKRDGCCPETMCRGDILRYLSYSHYIMVRDCPQGGDINRLCKRSTTAVTKRVEDLLPVTGNGTTFYNKHCALCHNVSEYVSWSLNITCKSYVIFQNLSSPQAILEKALHSYCTVKLIPPKGIFPQGCYIPPPVLEQVTRGEAPLSLLLNFNTKPSSTEGVTTHQQVHGNQNCSGDQWRHHSQDVCHKVRCAKGKQLVGEKCVSVIGAIKGLLYHFYTTLVSTAGVTTHCPSELVRYIMEKLDTELYLCTVHSQLVDENEVMSASGSSGLIEDSLDCKIVVTETVSRDEYEKELLTILNTSFHLTCRYNKHYLDLPTTDVFADDGRVNFADNEFTEVSPFLLCRYVVFNLTQYNEDNKTGCVALNDSAIILCAGEFRVTEQAEVHVCVDTLKMKYDALVIHPNSTTYTITSVHVTIQFFLSYGCIILSLSCLLATFIVYLIFPSLRSLPAKNNICLIFNLFWAQGLLQFGINLNVNRLICQIIGVLIHFFWLSALLFMNVCSFHMYSVFSYHKMAVMPKHSSTKRLIKYILYTYMVTGLIVATTILSQYIQSEGNTIGYGERYCYLSSAALVGFAFALPLGAILCLNVMMFVMAVRSIAQTSRIENEVLTRGRNKLQVYIKLSTLTGLFWVFGILAELFKYHALVYLSIVLNGSQGVFIFIACVCNKRVLRLMKCRQRDVVQSSDKTKTTNLKSVSSNSAK